MAFEILKPEVGTRLINTFSALAEENRKRQEMALNQEKSLQNILLKDAALAIRERAVDVSAQRAANNYETAMRRLDYVAQAEERLRGAEARRESEWKQKQDASAKDEAAANDFSLSMTNPGPNGEPSLSQRLHSADPKISEQAEQEFTNIAVNAIKNSGKGTLTMNSIRFADSNLSKDRQARLAAAREARLAQSAEESSARADRAQADREKRTSIMEGEAEVRKQKAFGGGATKKQGEFYAGGSGKLKVPGFGFLTFDQIRETLASGGEVAASLKKQMKEMPVGTTPDGEPIASPWDDAALDELETQGKKIIEQKKTGASSGAPKTPSGVAIDPVTETNPAALDEIFDRPVPQLNSPVPAAATGAEPSVLPPLPPVPGVGAAAVPPMETFFGLPRTVRMA